MRHPEFEKTCPKQLKKPVTRSQRPFPCSLFFSVGTRAQEICCFSERRLEEIEGACLAPPNPLQPSQKSVCQIRDDLCLAQIYYFFELNRSVAIAPSKRPAPSRPYRLSSSPKSIHASKAAVKGSQSVTILVTVAESERMPT
jgi:hypothetical protein